MLHCAVDAEQHMIFDCEAFRGLRLDPDVAAARQAADGSVRHFVVNPKVDVVCSFISSAMELVDAQTFTGAEQPC
jgi:hypothetical protein